MPDLALFLFLGLLVLDGNGLALGFAVFVYHVVSPRMPVPRALIIGDTA